MARTCVRHRVTINSQDVLRLLDQLLNLLLTHGIAVFFEKHPDFKSEGAELCLCPIPVVGEAKRALVKTLDAGCVRGEGHSEADFTFKSGRVEIDEKISIFFFDGVCIKSIALLLEAVG